MVASRQVKLLHYTGIGRQRGKGFGVLAQIVRRTAIPFLRIFAVPAAKRVGADLMQFVAPENVEVFRCTIGFNSSAKKVGRQTFKKQLTSGVESSKNFPAKYSKQASQLRIDN